MPDPYVGEIRLFGGNYAPEGWALCDGSSLEIAQHPALFSAIGNTYGQGATATSFRLPDLRGCTPIHVGIGPGLSHRHLGQRLGAEEVALTESDIPAHTHTVYVGRKGMNADKSTFAGNFLGNSTTQEAKTTFNLFNPAGHEKVMHWDTVADAPAGALGRPHPNMMPSQCVNYIIALEGTLPSSGKED